MAFPHCVITLACRHSPLVLSAHRIPLRLVNPLCIYVCLSPLIVQFVFVGNCVPVLFICDSVSVLLVSLFILDFGLCSCLPRFWSSPCFMDYLVLTPFSYTGLPFLLGPIKYFFVLACIWFFPQHLPGALPFRAEHYCYFYCTSCLTNVQMYTDCIL